VHLVRRNIVILTEASNIGKVGIKMCTNVLASLLFLIEISRIIDVLLKTKRYRRLALLSSYVKIIQDIVSTDEPKHSRPYAHLLFLLKFILHVFVLRLKLSCLLLFCSL